MSWRSATQPLPKEVNPKLVFERLFTNGRPGESAEARAKRERYHKSVLDFALEDNGFIVESNFSNDLRHPGGLGLGFTLGLSPRTRRIWSTTGRR